MGGHLYVCDLSEASWRGVAKPGIFFWKQDREQEQPAREILENEEFATNDQNEKFSKTGKCKNLNDTKTTNQNTQNQNCPTSCVCCFVSLT